MIIKKQYKTPNRLIEMVNNIQKIENAISNDLPSVSLSKVEWVSPWSIFPIAVYANNNGITIDNLCENPNVNFYLNTQARNRRALAR